MEKQLIENFLRLIRIDDNRAYLPATPLDKKLYNKFVKKPLDQLGGKWNTTLKCYEFLYNPTERIGDLIKGEKINLISKYQYFGTPIELVGHMLMFCQESKIDWSQLDADTSRILEPGAGRGNILKVMAVQGFKNLHYYELMPENRVILNKELKRLEIPATYLGEDFLKGSESNFDMVIANPPFRNDRKHIRKMFDVTREGGIVLTLGGEELYHDEKFCSFMDTVAYPWEMRKVFSDQEDPIFEGTPTGCTIIAARKRTMVKDNSHDQSPSRKTRKQLPLF